MKYAVLTYNVPHRKTYDLLCILKAKGYQNIIVYAVPFQYQKNYEPLLNHRPVPLDNIMPQKLSENLDYYFVFSEDYEELNNIKPDKILIAGGGLYHKSLF